ncbi:hypothetical protein V5799_017830 [Amblyomma americanum]|uniref:Myb/SANT-like DNA-binding domain-containing protein n=1 Tax=Amblyomma americanum TaxID=6943 RepID=A0AAQ4F1H5_AMBAM
MAGRTWNDKETHELIRIWTEHRDLLDGTSRNNKVYESMAAQMCILGHPRTALQVKEKMKRLRKEYKCGKRSMTAPYHEQLATVLAQGAKAGALFTKSEMDDTVGSEVAGKGSEANHMEDRAGCSAPPDDDRAQGFCGSNQGLDDSRSSGSPPVESAPALRFLADGGPNFKMATTNPEDSAPFPAAGVPRAARKRKLLDAPSPPTLSDRITRAIDKVVELEREQMRHELGLLERLRREELERVERMRREEMDHELRIMIAIASVFNNLNSSSSSSEPPAGS